MSRILNTHVFTHIPKTGGTTLISILIRQYLFRPGYIYKIWKPEHLRSLVALPEAHRARISLIRGHIPYGIHQHLPLPVIYFTFLRDPVARVVSAYNGAKKFTTNPHHQRVNQSNYTLKQFVTDGFSTAMDNGQVRFLSGITDIPFGSVSEEHFQLAIRNLDNYLIGINERFDESILMLAARLQWTTPYYHRLKVSGPAPDIDEETLQLIRRSNHYDQLLYNNALIKFQQQLTQQAPDFAQQVQEFRSKNERRKKITLIEHAIFKRLQFFSKYIFRNVVATR